MYKHAKNCNDSIGVKERRFTIIDVRFIDNSHILIAVQHVLSVPWVLHSVKPLIGNYGLGILFTCFGGNYHDTIRSS